MSLPTCLESGVEPYKRTLFMDPSESFNSVSASIPRMRHQQEIDKSFLLRAVARCVVNENCTLYTCR